MARAAVIPQSPAKRTGRTSTQSTAAADAKRKAPRKATVATRTATPTPNVDSDDTDDELGFITNTAKPRGRVAARQAVKTKTTPTTRAKKVSAERVDAEPKNASTSEAEAPKKRVGRPRKTPPAEETTTPKPATAAKTRGRPRAATPAAKAPIPAPTRRTRLASESVNQTKPKNIQISTSSIMRSNISRGPAKKKTVTFQDLTESEEEDVTEPEAPAAGRKRAAAKPAGSGKAGLGATPVRKAPATGTRGRKPAAAKKGAAKPLSPKKDKQVAKSLSAYASSDDEDELNTIKSESASPVRLVVRSPVKHGLETSGLSSPVRRINFTPKKAASFIDENGEPKLPTPKHGSEGTGLSSPVRRINFTPNRSQNAVAENGHLALPPGNSINFNQSGLMGSPARRAPTSSPFKFSLRETPNRAGSLFLDSANPVSAPDFAPANASPLKMSPKKANLGASFSQSALKASAPPALARTPLFQSPAKRIASPFKSSIFSAHASVSQTNAEDDGTPTKALEPEETTTPKSSPLARDESRETSEQDCELVQDVARDIFNIDIELSADDRTPSPDPTQREEVAFTPENDRHLDDIAVDMEVQNYPESEQAEDTDLADEIQYEYEEPETLCFDAMEEANLAPEEFDDQATLEYSDIEYQEGVQEDELYEYEEPETLCFDAMEDAQMETDDLQYDEIRDDSTSESGSFIQDVAPFEYEEAESLCFDTMEDEYLAGVDLVHPTVESVDSETDDMEIPGAEQSDRESETDQGARTPSVEYDSPEPSPTPVRGNIEMDQLDVEEDTNDEVMSDNDQAENSGPSSTNGFHISSPHEANNLQTSVSSAQRIQSPFSPASSSLEVSNTTPVSANCLDDTENGNDSTPRVKNANASHTPSPFENKLNYMPEGQVDSPALMAPSLFNTPSVAAQHHTPTETGLGFTPLAQRFDRWEQDTPSQARSLRPRRRGVFSLVGPLERTSAAAPDESGSVSYPDISKSSLANTPSFTELPLQPQSDDTSMSPEHDQTPRQSAIYERRKSSISPAKHTEIFEDPLPDSTRTSTNRRSLVKEDIPASQNLQDQGTEDKENCGPPTHLPVTPIKTRPQTDDHRTVHTVSKVPLKAEGEVSPLKLSRKRGLSLSATSPTRSSPRVRKPAVVSLNDNFPVLPPPRKAPRVSNGSPTTKRHSTMGRRSSGRGPVVASPGPPAATASPFKKPRRSISKEQKALHGAVVHVDVHTTEGEDASGIFVELLQQMGARCVKSWSWNPGSSLSPVDGADPKDSRVGITHVVYKDGGLRTLEKVKKAAGLVKCVGVGWVLDCERESQWLDETPYAVDSSIIPRGGAKRRKSMEPRALSNINGTLVRISGSPTPSASGRRSGAGQGAVDGFRKITPPTHQQEVPSTPPRQSSATDYQYPATPGYNFANLDAIGMSPATPGFLGNRSKLVQQSCPPKQSNRGLFPGAKPSITSQDDGDDEDSRRQRRFRMEAARRKSLVYKPTVASPLVP
ncbi:hypothetical protein MYU51_017725 [Penicillium brevicompactum]|uniref:uncharacterized protein n=1 Tax=Penicillium brevicompactum TaxID=5074 RepID=UPI002541230A|nr:uncharacterized protein N7506_010350 [Penicillium brevicompactum]KAJ5327248.1 hypothetical protein N7506_010350 [Penicillium brevicompactum]